MILPWASLGRGRMGISVRLFVVVAGLRAVPRHHGFAVVSERLRHVVFGEACMPNISENPKSLAPLPACGSRGRRRLAQSFAPGALGMLGKLGAR